MKIQSSRPIQLFTTILLPLLALLLWSTPLFAQDKSGVKPQVITLPSGPGSLEGLGETFQPDLSTGTSSYPVKFTAAPGRGPSGRGFQPEISLNYNGGNANGPWGMGWKLSIPSIQRRTEGGLPTYDDTQDTFIYSNGEKLVPLHDGTYRFENESSFMRFRQVQGGGWTAQTPDGMRYLFGESENTRVANHLGTFRWELERVIDTHGNVMLYTYLHDGEYAYPREIRYNMGQNDGGGVVYNAVVFNYEPRPDTFTDRRSGSPIRVGLRGTDIQMWALGKLVRAYKFTYEPERSTGKYSLLTNVTQVGDDGTSTLPPHTFTYTQFDPTAYTVVTMQNPPPVALTNPDADLVDINADGLPDLVYTPEDGQHRFYLNRGQGRWQVEPVLPENSPAERLSNPNVRMADVNGDGRVDLLVKASGAGNVPLYYYSNQNGTEWTQSDRVDFGPSPSFDLNDPNVQLVDFNNDHRIDVGVTVSGRLKIWLAQEGAWSQEADFDVPAPAAGGAARFDDPKIKVVDMSGDGLQDLAMVRDGMVVLWEHNGNGNYEEGHPILNPPTGVGANESAIQMDDLNNDGQGDLVMAGNGSVTYWLSLGDGSLTDPIVLQNTPAYNAADTAVRLADIDGDGASELVYSSPAGMQYVDFSVGGQPFLLASVDNGRGRTIEIDYKSSINDAIADWDAGNPWQVTLPFPVQVVRSVVVHDASSGDAYTIDYHYRDGYYDGVQKEFRGFVRSQEIKRGDETAATSVTNLVYDVGRVDESRKGMLLESEVLAEGGHCSGDYVGCFEHIVNQLVTRVVVAADQTQAGKPIAFAYVGQSDTFVHGQQAEPVHLRQAFEQDSYGNVTKELNYGVVCGDGATPDLTCGNDELLTYSEYIADEAHYILDRPMRVYQTDAAGNLLSETRLYYDGEPFVGLPIGQLTRGDLSRQEENTGPNGNNLYIQTKRHQFDQYGNVIGIMDANGNLTTVEYDAQMHAFPVLERLHLGNDKSLSYAASYQVGLGQVSAATDYNGQPHRYIFDTFGRLSKVIEPGDTLEKPTTQYRYVIGNPRSAVITEQRERSGTDEVYTSVTYFDGLGRKLQTRSEAEGGQVVVTNAVAFNARQSVRDQYLPYYDTGLDYKAADPASPHATQYYDPLSRMTRRQNPDGTFSSVEYKPLMQVLSDEEDNNPASPQHNTPRTLTYDGLKRLIGVEEINLVGGQPQKYTTHYEYDHLGHLTRIVDAQGNIKTQTFDALDRKLTIDDPDGGHAAYTYDNAGNVVETVDAKGQRIHYTFDAANRIVNLNFVSGDGDLTPEVIYHYDADLSPDYADAQNTQGRLAWVADESGAEYLSYDARGNIAGRIKRVRTPGSTSFIDFAMRMRYDAMQRLVEYTFPDGVVQSFGYNEQSFLETVPGYVNNIDYMALGKRSRIETADGAVTTYGYDQRQRLTTLRTSGPQDALYQDWHYQLDGVNNILRIDDLRPGAPGARTAADDATELFTYDSLNRLLSTQYASGDQVNFGYDPLGNLIHKASNLPDQNLGDFQVGQDAGPHALTQVNGATWQYDANGSLVAKPGFAYTWDFQNRLTVVDGPDGLRQQNTFDYTDRRIAKVVNNGAESTRVLYPDRSVEVRGDQLVKYFFANDERIAEVRTPFNPARLIHGFAGEITPPPAGGPSGAEQTHTLFYHGDHLGSATVLVDPTGKVVERRAYHPFGEARDGDGATQAAYSYTGKELDAEIGLFYYGARFYDPAVGRFISVDPLYFEHPEKDLVDPQSLNLYAYVHNNPVRNIDPDGRDVVIAYGVGDQEAIHKKVADTLAQNLRNAKIQVTVVRANDLLKPAVQEKLAGQKISAAIYVGHGNVNTIGLSSERRAEGVRWIDGATPERFAQMAGVKQGGVAAFLSCNVVNGQTSSEEAMKKSGITAIGYDRKFYFRDDGQVQSPDRHVKIDPNAPLPRGGDAEIKEDPWFQPGDVKPSVQSGPNQLKDGTVGAYVKAAEERVGK